MTYQRGTDLKHCPDGCDCLIEVESPEGIPGTSLLTCLSKKYDPSDTCPREQADFLIATYRKERTNG